jgi:hypothetical protein
MPSLSAIPVQAIAGSGACQTERSDRRLRFRRPLTVAHTDAVANYEMKEGPPKGLRVEALSVPTNCDSVPQELGRSGRRHRPH